VSGFDESAIAGVKLKDKCILHWQNPKVGATNEAGFAALPGGSSLINHDFPDNGDCGFFRSSAIYTDLLSRNTDMGYNYVSLISYMYLKTKGESVRCF
jgi:hypothetical protein